MSVQDSLIMKTFALWARAKGIKRPDSREGMQILFQEFLADQPTWKEISGNVPLELGVNGATINIQNDADHVPDDFDDLVAERGRLLEEMGGDDLARDIVMMDRQRQALSKEAPFIRWSPPSARKATLGGQATVSSDGKLGGFPNQASVLQWSADDDSETTPVAVTLGVNQSKLSAAAGTNLALKPFGIIKFGTRASLEVEVDIALGTQVVVAGAEIRVDVSMDPAVGSEVAASMNLAAMITYGAVARTTVPTRTRYFGSIGNGAASALTTIPRFATTLQGIWRSDQTLAVRLDFLDANANVVGQAPLAANTLFTQYSISIPPNAQFIQLNNTGASPLASSNVVFGLTI